MLEVYEFILCMNNYLIHMVNIDYLIYYFILYSILSFSTTHSGQLNNNDGFIKTVKVTFRFNSWRLPFMSNSFTSKRKTN